MDAWIKSIMNKVDAQTRQDAEEAGQMTLGRFIVALEGVPQDALIRFDVGGNPGEPLSYRGYYSDLAFGYDGPPATTVADVLTEARAAMGRGFEGYKGGNYIMHENTLVWVASYGTSSDGRRILGVSLSGGHVIVLTAPEE